MDGLPALLGGEPIRPGGPPDWPPPDEAVRAALERAWRDGSWGRYTSGHVQQLEERLAAGVGVPHALTCASGTLAVELALRALRVGNGDQVVLAGYDYGGNFLCVHAVGAVPVLVDVEPGGAALDPGQVAEALGPATRAVIASHLHGGLADMAALTSACAARGVALVEDAAQVPGATVQGRPAGGWGDVSVFSFGGSKLLTAGRGGALVTRRADLLQRARLALNRGTNIVAPLSELQAIALLPQLDRLAERHARRAAAVTRLEEGLAGLPGLRLFQSAARGAPAYYKVGMWLDEAAFGLGRDRLVQAARAEGIALDEGFRALHAGRSPSRWRAAGPLLQSERTGREVLVLHHPVLLCTDEEIDQVARALRRIHAHAAALAVPRN
jgi:dTDP-4-amino-4,6-dideoxygalactose transaminase